MNGVKHTYTLNGTQIVSEAWGNQLVLFIYDESGAPIGMQYRKSTYAEGEFDCFFYEKNLQGDIIGIFNEAGTRVVTYCYDAYGIPLATYVSGYEWVKNANPMLYRGYYYDRDMQIYYLNSRYYDSRTGRFISADNVMSNAGGTLMGYNLYAYCFNNPVNQFDASGSWPKWVHTYVINPAKAVAEFVSDVVEDIKNYDSTNESEAVVFESNYFSNYKGAVVVKTPFDASFSIGFIGLSHNDYGDHEMLKHEYGHTRQFNQIGWENI